MADDRTDITPLNVNEQIQDRTIRHMVFLERFKASEVRRIQKILNEQIIPEITAKIEKRLRRILERGSDLGPTTTRRLRDLERELERLVNGAVDQLQRELVRDLTAFSRDEIDWQARVIRDSLGFDLDFVIPNPRSVAAIIKRTSFAGLTLDQWFSSVSRSTQRNIMIAVQRGIVEGETTAQIIRRIRGTRRLRFTDGVWNSTRRQAEAVTRSMLNHAANQARTEFFKENDDLIKGLQWTSTLDSRTSVICAGLDGKLFPIDKGPRPPAHVNCRSVMTAVLKSARQLGLKGLTPGKRASINGQVPSTLTFGEWLRRQPVSVQNNVLGVSKARLFRDGNLPIDRFTNSSLQPLTLDQLRELEKNAFDMAGL